MDPQYYTFVWAFLSQKKKCFLPQPNVKQKIHVFISHRKTNQTEGYVFVLEAWTGVKQRAFGDWHIQRVPCQSCTQSISSSQSVLFVCWICFGTCRPLIDMGAGAGKTLLWCEANNGPSVTLPQMFGLRRYTDIIMVQKSGHSLPYSHSLSFLSPLFVLAALKHSPLHVCL